MTICLACDEPITNPICPNCLGREMSYWLDMKKPDLVKPISKKVKEFNTMMPLETEDNCITCNRGMRGCAYCFTEYIYDWLKKENPGLVSEFIKFFNFDLKGNGYKKEAEDLDLM
ncbi:MAG TPA: hypothetical protein VJB94_05010 [Candidatus Nanoarchaeia archaeon]|nr:hypothetical protein [Candidatus Nanoarchaeia archaeon]